MSPKKKKTKPAHPQQQLAEAIVKAMSQEPNKTFNYRQVSKRLGVKEKDERRKVLAAMDLLVEGDVLILVDAGRYKLKPVRAYADGIIDITSNGAAYVMSENYEDEIYIAPNNVKNALHGDHVKVYLYAHKKNKKPEGEIVQVIQRAKTTFSGILHVSPRFAFLIPDSRKMLVDIFIPLNKLNEARDGQKAVAEITNWPPGQKNPEGKIIEILGWPGENTTEMHSILVEYGFPTSFPESVEAEATRIPEKISEEEISKRRDFRKVTTFTIDPVDAKDFDDALSVRKLGNGHYEIGIHIADVTHFVRPGTELEREAYKRATSVYLVDRVIPMLPEKLSNNICSLRPQEERLCFSAVFEMNEDAEVISQWFGKTIIFSDKRFTYEEAQKVIETKEGLFADEILLLDRLAKKLRSERFRKGSIAFEKVEVKFRLDSKGNPDGVYLKENKDSNKLIEEFMLLANKKVAERIGKIKTKGDGHKPFVYRIHDVPSPEKLADFSRFASGFGYKVSTGSDRQTALSLNKLMKDVRGKAEQNVLEQLAIRTMAKAVYSVKNIGHYGLAFDYYTHFTSPIRRYPDMMVHRLLDHYMDHGRPGDEKELEQKCKHSSEMEFQAADAERSSVKYMQVRFLEDKKDQVFEGLISGVTEWGIYVEIVENKCEGLVRLRDIDDDYYELDERNYCIKGSRKGKIFRLGDRVQVTIKSTDLVRRQINFVLAQEASSLHAPRSSKGERKSKKKFRDEWGFDV